MKRIVYFLGAGFSAPLGLPLIADFIIKAKDQHTDEPDRFAHFLKVFDLISRLADVKNYYETDLFNIENVLSLIESQALLDGPTQRGLLERFIKDVITYYTRTPPGEKGKPHPELARSAFGGEWLWNAYGCFVLEILGLRFDTTGSDADERLVVTKRKDRPARYDIVTMNYDNVLENTARHLVHLADNPDALAFGSPLHPAAVDRDQPVIAKLHGGVDDVHIVPPAWNKQLHVDIVPVWRTAHSILRDASEIRFLGYSLPAADAYVQYFLRSAALGAPHLKKIDALCLDPDGDVYQRYMRFVDFQYFRFRSAHIENYLDLFFRTVFPLGSSQINAGQLEAAHEAFFSTTRTQDDSSRVHLPAPRV